MNLVKNTERSYINMDTIESIFEDVKGNAIIKRARCISGEIYDISEEAYKIILVYGKAKIQ